MHTCMVIYMFTCINTSRSYCISRQLAAGYFISTFKQLLNLLVFYTIYTPYMYERTYAHTHISTIKTLHQHIVLMPGRWNHSTAYTTNETKLLSSFSNVCIKFYYIRCCQLHLLGKSAELKRQLRNVKLQRLPHPPAQKRSFYLSSKWQTVKYWRTRVYIEHTYIYIPWN